MELPLGFGMALAQNEAAMHVFEAMTDAEKQAVLEQCHQVHSKQEMQMLVARLEENGAQGNRATLLFSSSAASINGTTCAEHIGGNHSLCERNHPPGKLLRTGKTDHGEI